MQDITPIHSDKLIFFRKDYSGVNMIYFKAFGTQYEEDVSTVMNNISIACHLKSPSMSIVDMREMKATMYKNIGEITAFVRSDLKELNLLFVVYKNKSIGDFSSLAGIFGGYKVINIKIDDYKNHLDKIDNTSHFMILIDGSEYTIEAGVELDDPFDPYNGIMYEFADRLGSAYGASSN